MGGRSQRERSHVFGACTRASGTPCLQSPDYHPSERSVRRLALERAEAGHLERWGRCRLHISDRARDPGWNGGRELHNDGNDHDDFCSLTSETGCWWAQRAAAARQRGCCPSGPAGRENHHTCVDFIGRDRANTTIPLVQGAQLIGPQEWAGPVWPSNDGDPALLMAQERSDAWHASSTTAGTNRAADTNPRTPPVRTQLTPEDCLEGSVWSWTRARQA
jgi:hypothetical protein